MEYIHVKSLEKYHPGYKDRTLQWAKIYINMADGDPDTELIENEIDWARFIKLILLELRAQKPLPNSDQYWSRKGFDLNERPMSLTIKMLHNFLDIVTDLGETVTEPLRRVDKIREEKSKEDKADFLTEIRKNPIYKNISIDTELGKMDSWLLAHPHRKKTKRFVVNWLNRAVENQAELPNNGKPSGRPLTAEEMEEKFYDKSGDR